MRLIEDSVHGELGVYSGPGTKSVVLMPKVEGRFAGGTAAADLAPTDIYLAPGLRETLAKNIGVRAASWCWWIARVVVRDREMRGLGAGTTMLRRLLIEIGASAHPIAVVSPGGYDGDTDRQVRFYEKCGFVPVRDDPGGLVMIWTL